MASAIKARASTTTMLLYRDLLRMGNQFAGKPSKAGTIKAAIRTEFERNRAVADPARLHFLKATAPSTLANYLSLRSALLGSSVHAGWVQPTSHLLEHESVGLKYELAKQGGKQAPAKKQEEEEVVEDGDNDYTYEYTYEYDYYEDSDNGYGYEYDYEYGYEDGYEYGEGSEYSYSYEEPPARKPQGGRPNAPGSRRAARLDE